MNEQWKESLAELRKYLKEHRAVYHDGLKHTRRERVSDFDLADTQLRYLVPLYRAFLALSQQPRALNGGASRGVVVYMRKFAALQRLLGDVANYPCFGREDQFLGVKAQGMRFPDPHHNWELRTVETIYDDVKKEQSNRRSIERQKRNQAEAARKAFLGNLTESQRTLLKQALEAAKATGVHAVTFDERDLPAQSPTAQ
ncbi:hypothetical protein WJ96_05335 [Burkholderia ubonensis]|uniref:Uncharacterized protein n=1 Tax=Burkholderia ubonensis TaxID=101571 RepID=A0AAW3MYC3_9BURK|nr:hypothetical protein [Burkholderia ubonensis]KVP97995.1 hypothetical protein WJ96_05335 [Burkholderia ubonensis]KVZ92693.1 hypothetical protein WL25_16995 [Burkholderia ubonensis]